MHIALVVKDLVGNEYNLKLPKRRKKNYSKLHTKAVECIYSVYPTISIAEEIPVKVEPGLTLYLDIYVPILGLIVEVHGAQHYKFNKHFHKYPHRFGRARLNDDLKREWCEINGFKLIELPYNESRDEWEARLRTAIRYTVR